MEKKIFLVVLFLLFNFLTVVYAIDENPNPDNPDPDNPDPVNPDPVNPDPVNPDPVNPDPNPPNTTTDRPDKTLGPVTTSTQKTTTTQPIIFNSTIRIVSGTTSFTRYKTTTTKALNKQPTKTNAPTKRYPQSTFVPYDDNNDELPLDYLSLLYIMSAAISTLLLGFASYSLYKKGLGDETSNASKTWENNFEDDGYRNKSTISRNTLTPSITVIQMAGSVVGVDCINVNLVTSKFGS